MTDEFKTLKKFEAGNGREGFLHSLPALEEQGVGKISRLPVSIRIVLESVLRNCDGEKVRRKDVETLANWNAKSPANEEIPFIVARDRKSTRLNSSHVEISYAVFCLKKKKTPTHGVVILD